MEGWTGTPVRGKTSQIKTIFPFYYVPGNGHLKSTTFNSLLPELNSGYTGCPKRDITYITN